MVELFVGVGVAGALIVIVWASVALSRRSPARLSDEGGEDRRGGHVVDRPADAGAEAMGVDRPGQPTTSGGRGAGPR